MFALIHFIFILFKIAILATVYATLTFLIIYILSKTSKNALIKKWMIRKYKTWWLLGFIFSVGLFIFSLTYWGNHGLGDSSRIPVGHGQAILNGDGVWTYFYPDLNKIYDQKHIKNFIVYKNKLFAEQDNDKYLVYDFKTSELIEFENKKDYEEYALKNSFPKTNVFKDFISNYHDYWSGWRFYLLP